MAGKEFYYGSHLAEVISDDKINGYMCYIPTLGKHIWLQEWEIKQGME